MLRSPVAHNPSASPARPAHGFADPRGLLLIGALVLLASVLTFAMINARVRGSEKKAARDRVARLVETQKNEEARLLARNAYLKTTEGIESEARNQGMVRTGEESMRLPEDKIPSTPPLPPTIPGPIEEHSTATGMLLAVLALFTLAFFSGLALLYLRWRATHARPPGGDRAPHTDLHRQRPAHGR